MTASKETRIVIDLGEEIEDLGTRLHDATIGMLRNIAPYLDVSPVCSQTHRTFVERDFLDPSSEDVLKEVTELHEPFARDVKQRTADECFRFVRHGRILVGDGEDGSFRYVEIDKSFIPDFTEILERTLELPIDISLDHDNLVNLLNHRDAVDSLETVGLLYGINALFEEIKSAYTQMYEPTLIPQKSDQPGFLKVFEVDPELAMRLPQFKKAARLLARLNQRIASYGQIGPETLARQAYDMFRDQLAELVATQFRTEVAKMNQQALEATPALIRKSDMRQRRIASYLSSATVDATSAEVVPEKPHTKEEAPRVEVSLHPPVDSIEVELKWLDGEAELQPIAVIDHNGRRVYIFNALSDSLENVKKQLRKKLGGIIDGDALDERLQKTAMKLCEGAKPNSGLPVKILRERRRAEAYKNVKIWYQRGQIEYVRFYMTFAKLCRLDPRLSDHPDADADCIVLLAETDKHQQTYVMEKIAGGSRAHFTSQNVGST